MAPKSIPKVAKIFGPGNAWVTEAKMQVAQDPKAPALNMPAGPSELMIIADDRQSRIRRCRFTLTAEHGPDSQVILVSTSEQILEQVATEVQKQTQSALRRDIIEKSLNHARLIFANDVECALNIANDYAPEHLILVISKPEQYVAKINNAGAVFLGRGLQNHGDYITAPIMSCQQQVLRAQ